MRKEEEEIQREMTRIRKEMEEERRKKTAEELQYDFTLFHIVCILVILVEVINICFDYLTAIYEFE